MKNLMLKKHWEVKQSDNVVRASGSSSAQLVKENVTNEEIMAFARKHAAYPDDVNQYTEGEVFVKMNPDGDFSGYGYVTLFLA